MRATFAGMMSCSRAQQQHRVDRRMGAAAARVLLDREAGPDDVVGPPPVLEDRLGVEIAGAVEHIEKALLVFERAGLAVNPSRASSAAKRPLRAVCPTCSGLVIVPKLALMPEASEAAIASACAVRAAVEAEQVAARRRGAEHAEGRGRVPALLVMMVMHAAADPRLGLEPGDIGGDEGAAGAVERLAEREQRRQDRRRRVAAQRVADIVEIERVRRGAVDQRGVERRGAAVAAEDQALAAAAACRAPARRSARRARRRPPGSRRPCRGSPPSPTAPPPAGRSS